MAINDISLTIDGEPQDVYPDGTIDVTVKIDRGDDECAACGQPIAHYADKYELTSGWAHEDGPGSLELCGNLDLDDVRADLEDGQEITCELLLDKGIEYAEPTAFHPISEHVNWIGATVKQESVSVQISVGAGDERGFFEMQVWPGLDANGKPVLYLRVPNPADSAPHAALTPLGDNLPGTYVIG